MAVPSQGNKVTKGLLIVLGILMLISIIITVCFATTRLWGYVDIRDYEETECHVGTAIEWKGDDNQYKLWCSCNDEAILREDCTNRPYSIKCYQLMVYTIDANAVRVDTWLRRSDVKAGKGEKCTNSCEYPDPMHGIAGRNMTCHYNTADPADVTYLEVQSFARAFHSVFWSMLVFTSTSGLFVLILIIHLRRRKSASYA